MRCQKDRTAEQSRKNKSGNDKKKKKKTNVGEHDSFNSAGRSTIPGPMPKSKSYNLDADIIAQCWPLWTSRTAVDRRASGDAFHARFREGDACILGKKSETAGGRGRREREREREREKRERERERERERIHNLGTMHCKENQLSLI